MSIGIYVLAGCLLLLVGALLALGVVGILFMRRAIRRMDDIEDSMKNIKVEIVEGQ